MPIVPPRNLDTASDRWGAWAEGAILDLQREQTRSAQNEGNANKSAGATLGSLAETVRLLGEQVTDLSQRKTYVNSQPLWDETRDFNVSITTSASITFTLTETRTVLIRASADMSARINGSAGSAGGGVSVSGLPSGMSVGASSLFASPPSASYALPISTQGTFTMAPGTYTLATSVSYSGSLSGATNVRIQNPSLYVQVLERA